jgi:hypothetical protein
MSGDSEWEFVGAVADGQSFSINGVDVWRHKWNDTKDRVRVRDPHYDQEFTFHVYRIAATDRAITFAAGEFSSCIWGFYIRKQAKT